MQLEEAREAKHALAEDLGLFTPRRRFDPGLQRDMIEEFQFEEPARPSVALGVSYIDGEFVPAVRVQDREYWSEPVRARMQDVVGGQVDIEYIGVPVKFDVRIRPLEVGTSIGNSRRTIGTLGPFVTRGQSLMIMSNNHVLADEDRAPMGDPISQPSRGAGGVVGDRIGTLDWALALRRGAINQFDVALCKVDHDQGSDLRVHGVSITGVRPHDPKANGGIAVGKVGRTSGYTEGVVKTFDLDNVQVRYDMGKLRFDDQLEIVGTPSPFSRRGDSGALVFSLQDQKALAMIFAGRMSGRFQTYAHPFEPLLAAAGATLAM